MSDTSHPSHHLKILPEHCAGNDGLGRYFLLPGSPGRAEMISKLFDEVTHEIITPRHNDTYLGRIYAADGRAIDVGVTSTGMGPATTEITAVELIQAGARRLIRVGTSGSVQFETVKIGSIVIATGAVRDELTSQHYAPLEVPALAHPDTVLAGEKAAFAMGLEDITYKGLVHTKASLFARAIFLGPLKKKNLEYKDEMIGCKVLSSEMEASALFIVAQTLTERTGSLAQERDGAVNPIKAGTVLGIIGGEDAWATDEQIKEIEDQTCKYSLQVLRELFLLDTGGGAAL